MDQTRGQRREHAHSEVPAGIPELTHRHLEAVLQLLKRAKAADITLIKQAEAQLRPVIVALTPLSPRAIKQRLQTRQLTKKRLLNDLHDACECLGRAFDEHHAGNIEHCIQPVLECQSIVTKLLTAW